MLQKRALDVITSIRMADKKHCDGELASRNAHPRNFKSHPEATTPRTERLLTRIDPGAWRTGVDSGSVR